MKFITFIPIVLFAISLQAQTASSSGAAAANAAQSAELSRTAAQTSAQASGQAAAATSADAASKAGSQAEHAAAASSAESATNISAELTKKIDTRNAKVGDEVVAKTTHAAKLSDGTSLPKGTRLLGKVTDVHARSKADKTSHLAFNLDRAVLRDGREVPVHAALTSVTGSAMASAVAADEMAMPAGGGAAGGGASGGGALGLGGALGGAGHTAGGVVGGAVNTAGGAGNAMQSTAGGALSETRAAGSLAGSASSSGVLEHVPVANLPGVTLSSAADTSSSGSLDGANKNISLESGTMMTLNMSAGQQ